MIKIPRTLSLYLAKHYVVNLIMLMLALCAIIYLFDIVELIRRAEKQDTVPLSMVFQMGLLKLPEVGQLLLPFAVLFSAMFTFWKLSRRSELIIVRSSGFSAWQFLAPIAAIALLTGLLQISIINPVGALLVSKFEQMERTYLSKQENQIALFKEGLWMRQVNTHTATENKDIDDISNGYVILHASQIDPKEWKLLDVSALHFNHNDKFIARVDAPEAFLRKDHWLFPGATIHKNNAKPEKASEYKLATALTPKDIQESFASTASMSFWNLPSYIETLERTGFDATKLRVHYQNLIAQPLLFIAMVILAATVSMRPPRFSGSFILISGGIAIGFIVFFTSSFLQALGSSGQIPIFLAAWSAPIVCFLFGVGMVLQLEDG